MNYNHGKAKKKFEREWKKTEAYFRENGMTEEQIAAMREFDLEAFKSDRRYAEHTADFSCADSIMIPSPEEEEPEFDSDLKWLDMLPLELADRLKELKKEKLIAFYYHIVYRYTLNEIAVIFNKNRCTIRQWIRKVYKICEAFKKNHHFCLSQRLYNRGVSDFLSENLEN